MHIAQLTLLFSLFQVSTLEERKAAGWFWVGWVGWGGELPERAAPRRSWRRMRVERDSVYGGVCFPSLDKLTLTKLRFCQRVVVAERPHTQPFFFFLPSLLHTHTHTHSTLTNRPPRPHTRTLFPTNNQYSLGIDILPTRVLEFSASSFCEQFLSTVRIEGRSRVYPKLCLRLWNF